MKSSLLKSLIHRRQILDGTARNDGVPPKPPGSDSSFINAIISSLTQYSSITQASTTVLMRNNLTQARSNQDLNSSNSNSKSSLIASILAPTGIVAVIGAIVGALFYKKNQSNSFINDTRGLFNRIFNTNSNSIVENKSEEKYLLVGNIS